MMFWNLFFKPFANNYDLKFVSKVLQGQPNFDVLELYEKKLSCREVLEYRLVYSTFLCALKYMFQSCNEKVVIKFGDKFKVMTSN